MAFYDEDTVEGEIGTSVERRTDDIDTAFDSQKFGRMRSRDDRRKLLKATFVDLHDYNYDEVENGGAWARFVMDFPPKAKHVLVVDMVEKISR